VTLRGGHGPSINHNMRSPFNGLSSALICLLAVGARAETVEPETELISRIDAALAKAGKYLQQKQSDDGAWRSETYSALRGGAPLSAYVMSSMFYLPQAGPTMPDSYNKGVGYLLGFVDDDGRIRNSNPKMLYPAYTASMASRAVPLLDRGPRNLQAQQAWLKFMRQRQLAEQLGWQPSDREYGGWGFSIELPRKPEPGQPKDRFLESNLSATLFGVAALRSAEVPADEPIYEKILVFVRRCQNFSDDPAQGDPEFDDGGFFFMPDDIFQNKAGVAGVDRHGRERIRSYGTMTADGLRALYRCGLPKDHPRVVAAKKWLETHFSATDNPGVFPEDRAVLQNATYYYWAWSVSHAFMGLGIDEIETKNGKVLWAEALAAELIKRQRDDGSWVNRFTDSREDDPLVATPWAAAALAVCRYVRTGEPRTLAKK
jgi:squalene-hopene/tetraprenyl-beta-curcumene cyclase